jgi:short-subunit dehydrogenase
MPCSPQIRTSVGSTSVGDMKLDGKTVLLTGATGGLGRAIASAVAARGATMILSSRKSEELEELAKSLPGSGHRTVVSDLAKEGAALALLAEAGAIDVLVANAGLPATGKLDSFTAEEIDRALRVNLEAPIQMTRQLIPSFTERGSGHFVYLSSIMGKTAMASSSLYCSTKFGLRGFAFCLRDDLRPSGVGVSVISPGMIGGAGMYAESGASAPRLLGLGTPEQVGAGVVRAIEHDRREVTVAPPPQRAMGAFAAAFPEVASRVAGSATSKIVDQVAAGQTHKR